LLASPRRPVGRLRRRPPARIDGAGRPRLGPRLTWRAAPARAA